MLQMAMKQLWDEVTPEFGVCNLHELDKHYIVLHIPPRRWSLLANNSQAVTVDP